MPFFEDHVLDEVRNAVNIVSLASEYVSLRKRGRNYLARCPFHNEKTPSFNVNEEKQIFMCFGCGLGGDAFKFIMQIEHLSFPESVRFLAERSGIRLPEASASHPAVAVSNSDVLRKAMAEAVATYHHCLRHTEEGKSALGYLADRGITEETVGRFSLGFSPPGGNYLVPLLQKKGFPVQALEDCGLAKRSEDGARVYDSFRGRVMFPITDVQGRPIAFGARATDGRPPKYLNSPETKLYNKSRNLYGLSFAKEAIKERGYAILVEGYMDFVVPFQQGVQNLVASLGTSLTPQQVELLGRYTHEVVVSYDPDSAGLAAAQRSLDLFLEGDFRVRVLRLPEGRDPDAYVRTSGAAAYRERAESAVPYLEFVLDAAISNQGALDDPKNKIHVMNTVLPYLARLPSAVERSDYVFRFARRLGIEDQQLLAETKRAAQQKRGRLGEESMTRALSMRPAEKKLLQLLLGHGQLQERVLPLCRRQDFEGLAGEKIFAALLDEYDQGRASGYPSLHRRFAGEAEQALLAQLEMEEMPESPSSGTAESYLSALRTMRLTAYKQQIVLKIAEAAGRNDDETLTRLLEQRVAVDRELVGLSRK